MEPNNTISLTIHDEEIAELANLLDYEMGLLQLLKKNEDLWKFETDKCIKYLKKVEKLNFTRHTVRQHSILYEILGKLGVIAKTMPVDDTDNLDQLIKFKSIRKKSRDILRKMTAVFQLDISDLPKFARITWSEYRYPTGFPLKLYYLTNEILLKFICQNYEKLRKTLNINEQARYDYCNAMSQSEIIKYTNLKDLLIDEIENLLLTRKANVNDNPLNSVDKYVDEIYFNYLHIPEAWQWTLLKYLTLKPRFFSSKWLTSYMGCTKYVRVSMKRQTLAENDLINLSGSDADTIIEIQSDIDDDDHDNSDRVFREATRNLLKNWTECVEKIFNKGAEYIPQYVKDQLTNNPNEPIDFNSFYSNFETEIFNSNNLIDVERVPPSQSPPLQYSQKTLTPVQTKPIQINSNEELLTNTPKENKLQYSPEGSDVIFCSEDQIDNDAVININESLETSQMLVDRLLTPGEALRENHQSQNDCLNKQNSSDIFDNSSNEIRSSSNCGNILTYQQPASSQSAAAAAAAAPQINYPISSTQKNQNEQIKSPEINQLIDDAQVLSPIFEELSPSKRPKLQEERENLNPCKASAVCLVPKHAPIKNLNNTIVPKHKFDPLTFDFRRKTNTVKLITPSKLVLSQSSQLNSLPLPAAIHLGVFDKEHPTTLNEIVIPPASMPVSSVSEMAESILTPQPTSKMPTTSPNKQSSLALPHSLPVPSPSPKLPSLPEVQQKVVENATNTTPKTITKKGNTFGQLMETGDSIFLSSQIKDQQTKNISEKFVIISNEQLQTPMVTTINGVLNVDPTNLHEIDVISTTINEPVKECFVQQNEISSKNTDTITTINSTENNINNNVVLSQQINDKKITQKPVAIVQSSQSLLLSTGSSQPECNKTDLSLTPLSPPSSTPSTPSTSPPSTSSQAPPPQLPPQTPPQALSPPSPLFEEHRSIRTNQEQILNRNVLPTISSLGIPLIETYGSITAVHFNVDEVDDAHFLSVKVNGNPFPIRLNEQSAATFLKLEKFEWDKFSQLLFTTKKFKYSNRMETPSRDEPIINRVLFYFFQVLNSGSLQYSDKYLSLVSLLKFGVILKDAYSQLSNCIDSNVLNLLGGGCGGSMDESNDDGN